MACFSSQKLRSIGVQRSFFRTKHVASLRQVPYHGRLQSIGRNSRCFCSSGVSVTELRELNASDYYSFIEEEAGSDLVVVDFYTDWCGPCKLMYPELVIMQDQFKDKGVRFVKFNCNEQNKSLGKKLDIRVAPTFFLYKNGEKVASMTGAKTEKLRDLVLEHL